ncbi:MAG TPA: hypothetical protein DCM45_00445, partial [Clostridiales bacterium]|nr:hypothetical protein [Clostridiales bacterium]
TTGCSLQAAKLPRAEAGVLDLSGWDLASRDSINLDGEWSFYWNHLLPPGHIGRDERLTGYYPVPGYWTDYEGLPLSSEGQATYRLRITGLKSDQLLSIKLPEIYTEYSFWVNSQLIAGNGPLANEDLHYISPDVFDFYTDTDTVELLLLIRNNDHVNAGIGQSLRLGTTRMLHRDQNFAASADLLLCFVCLSAGLFHLFVYFISSKQRELIAFGILCVAVGIRGLLSNETLLMQYIPDMPFIVGSRILTLTVPIIIIAIFIYTHALYKEDIPSLIGETLLAINIIYILTVLLVPSFVYSSLFKPFLVSVASTGLFGLFIAIKVVVLRRPAAWYYLSGIIFLVAAATNDILQFLQIVNSAYLLTAGVALFVTSQMVLLAERTAGVYRIAEKLAGDLRQKEDLAIKTETAYLGVQIKPHFLYNALNTIADCCQTNPALAEDLILSLSRYLRGTMDFANLSDTVTLGKEIELVRAYTSIESARFDNFEVFYQIEPGLLGTRIPPLTLQPLVENAIKHGIRHMPSGGRVDIVIRKMGDCIRICVTDNGSGIPGPIQANMLHPQAENGIGLYNVHTRLIRTFGQGLTIDSKVGAGTRICFDIPLAEEF